MIHTLTIPDPCREKWEDMTLLRHDCRYCGVCEKPIVDFTSKTDAEIRNWLKTRNGAVCGRFRADQLNRPLQLKKRRRTGLTGLAAGFAALLSAQQPDPGPENIPIRIEKTAISPAGMLAGDESAQTVRIISGQVKDTFGAAMKNVSIDIMDSKFRTFTDENGIFRLEIPVELARNEHLQLRAIYSGYQFEYYYLPKTIATENLTVPVFQLEPLPLLGQLLPTPKPTLKSRLQNFLSRWFYSYIYA